MEKQKGKDMTITERNNLVEIAKTKANGVYSKKPYKYAVKNGALIGYSDYFGNIYRCFSSFDSPAGKVERYNITKALKELI